jgi:hypothetical protein
MRPQPIICHPTYYYSPRVAGMPKNIKSFGQVDDIKLFELAGKIDPSARNVLVHSS